MLGVRRLSAVPPAKPPGSWDEAAAAALAGPSLDAWRDYMRRVYGRLVAVWVPDAFAGAAAGIAVGAGLGLAGLALTRWESTAATLHYTPNRWLVLIVTFVVSARVLYGLWRTWSVAEAGVSGTPMVLAFGIPESLGAGGMVIGYYFVYGLGLRRRIRKWQNRGLPMR